MANKIEYPSSLTYWIAMSGESFITYGQTKTTQVTESIHELVEYPTEDAWKEKLLTFGIDVDEEEKDV